ncbi:hypothetical protein ACH5RR_020972 [Cinchona calisaya]|uniref:Senescence regulator n=1 Tax=Cinchona calisaya TaxID=153742 RepID=A0ABD2ZG34_9GENT
MAASKSYFSRAANYRFLDTPAGITSDAMFELDESDVWCTARSGVSSEFRKPAVSSSRKHSSSTSSATAAAAANIVVGATAASLPVNVPDWPKILKDEYQENRRRDSGDDHDFDAEDGGGKWIPPHEFLARTRMASFSVHEGIGRTLKGRDLSRVRNAIWEKTGFQD